MWCCPAAVGLKNHFLFPQPPDAALSGSVGGSVSCVLGLDAVVLGEGGVSSGSVVRHVSVGGVSVSCGGDMELCGVDTLSSGAATVACITVLSYSCTS